jgi:hypothetical protein
MQTAVQRLGYPLSSVFLPSNNDTRNDVSGEQKIIKNRYSLLCYLIALVMALHSRILIP